MTFKDIKNFMGVLILFLFMFFAGFYMIQLNRIEPPYYGGKSEVFIPEDGDNGWVFSSGVLGMYYLVLGDYENMNLVRNYDDFGESEKAWIFIENMLAVIFFVGATFIIQITIFNMLISLMSVTHHKHNIMMDENSKRQRLLLQAEFTFQDNFYRKMSDKHFICVPLAWLFSCC